MHFKTPLKTFYWLNLFLAALFLLVSEKSNAQCTNYQVYESIATATVPTSGGVWTQTGLIIGATNPRTGANHLSFDAAGDAITTPQIATPGIFSFWHRKGIGTITTPLFVIETSPDNATWTTRGTNTVFVSAYTQFTVNLGALALTNVYVRIRDSRASGTIPITVDDISWTSTTATENIVIPSLGNCSQTISCGTTYSFTDMGGSSDTYNANIDQTITFTPSIGTNKIQLLFSAFNTESGNDGMVIYNGPTTASPIISSGLGVGAIPLNCPAGSFYGTTSPGTIISSDPTGAITIQFRSNGTIHNAGWVASVSCFAPPTVTSFTPSNDCTNTGTVVITGTGFTGASAVSIGGTAVTSFTVNSATQITAIVGSGTTGAIAVTTAGGTGTSGSTFTVNPLPANPSNPTSDSPQCATPGVTLTRAGTVPAGETWYWQTIPLGTNTTNSAATYVVSTAGTYYIRAQNNTTGCWSVGSGSVTIAISTILSAAINPSPTNGATGVCYAGAGAISSVTWAATAGATSYDVYFGAGSLPGTVTANAVTNIYNTGTLLANTTYYWKIVGKNACGDAIGSSTWTFTTAAITCTSYCASTSTSSTVHFTSFSTTGGTTNVSNLGSGYSLNGYGNFTTTQITTQALAGTVSFSTIISGIAGGAGVAIFVDWNQNGVFTDAGEKVYNSPGFVFTSPSGSFLVPGGASLGSTTMRIVTDFFSSTPLSCNTGITGETEDYTFTVISTLPCSGNPFGINVTVTSQTTATVTWTAATPAPANGYQYYLFTANTYPTGVTGSTAAGITTINLTGLTALTTYYIWIRSNCGGALGQGVWVGPVSFIQPNCSPGGGNGTTTLGCPYVTSGGFGLNGTDPPAIDCTTSSCVNLEATYLQLGNTTNYTVQSIPYAPPYQFNCLQNPVSVNVDDVWSPVINLPFNFCFYGNSYSSCIIGSNGILSFNTGSASSGSGYAFSNNLPSNTGALFANSIYGVYHDINPNVGGEVGWELITLNTGCRALVASWNNVPMFSNNSILYTGMMVLYENTNVIEVFIREKNVDNFDISPWNGGNAIVGLQNATATAAVVAPGRNGLDTNWEVSNEAWRFTPSGTSIASLKWYEGAGTTGPIVGTTAIVNVCPAATTTYTAEITYTLCNGVLLKVTDQTTVTVTNGKVWNGSVSTDWNVANNWTPSGVPTSLNCVVIPNVTNDPIISGASFNAYGLNLTILNGATLVMNSSNTLTITDFVKVNPTASFTIKNSASLIQVNNGAVNIGNIIMERMTTMRKTDYVYWSSPVQTFSAAAISPGTTTNYIYKWNPSIANTNGGLGNWVSGNDNPMILGKGYIVRGPTAFTTTPAAFTATFTGKPNNGIIQPQITRGNYSGVNYLGNNLFTITNLDDNWNLLGNPYPSAINATTFLTNNTNITGNVRLWTHGTDIALGGSTFYATFAYNYTSSDYVSYNGTGSTPPGFNGKIGAGQGFFVTMNEATAVTENVTFNNSLRSNTYSNSQFYRNNNDNNTTDTEPEPERHRIWLSLVDANNNAATTLVGYVNEATNQQDRMFDAEHVAENGMGIYSMIDEKAMIIQGRALPFNQNDTVPIGVTVTNNGIYNIAISTLDGLFENQSQEIYLEDSEIGIIHDLRAAPYTFTADTGMLQSRFILRYTNDSLGNDNLNANQTFAFITNNTLHIQSKENIAEVAIYEVTGKLVKTYQPNQTVNHIESEFNFAKGVYLAKIKLESGVITAKKLMN